MCIACEITFMDMLNALSPEERERILRENAEAARFTCEAPQDEPTSQPIEDERKP
jgi:hypothetical protein